MKDVAEAESQSDGINTGTVVSSDDGKKIEEWEERDGIETRK